MLFIVLKNLKISSFQIVIYIPLIYLDVFPGKLLECSEKGPALLIRHLDSSLRSVITVSPARGLISGSQFSYPFNERIELKDLRSLPFNCFL